ncbi:MAG: hypothetical protein KGN33_08165 [Paracoccaceae bacterium]|nr:hypothetical protein [Paracoccaceae bacterium]
MTVEFVGHEITATQFDKAKTALGVRSEDIAKVTGLHLDELRKVEQGGAGSGVTDVLRRYFAENGVGFFVSGDTSEDRGGLSPSLEPGRIAKHLHSVKVALCLDNAAIQEATGIDGTTLDKLAQGIFAVESLVVLAHYYETLGVQFALDHLGRIGILFG